MIVKDQLNRTLTFSETPKRVISLVPSQTELLVDLGLRDKLVGITKFCVHPVDLRMEVDVVGGTKNIHLDKIKALKPDVVICNKEENTEGIVQALSEFVPVWVSDIYGIEDVLDMINQLGVVLDVAQRAKEINATLVFERDAFLSIMKEQDVKKVAYLIWKKPYMAAGSQTFINTLLQINKFKNVFDSRPGRYPEVSLDDLNEADMVFLSSEPYPFKEADVLALKEALRKEVRLVDGEFFSWYGSRLVKAFAYFRTLHA
ncbi:MAG: iron complex transport system substrate-binding protein [Limisphaerales bacterium]|jgi:iron complex transport system substrate-binding protein